jgi:hypothetical protein
MDLGFLFKNQGGSKEAGKKKSLSGADTKVKYNLALIAVSN